MVFVYMMRNNLYQIYVGITQNPDVRERTHNTKQGAQFTKHSTTFSIVFLEEHATLASARKREIQIKKWRREKKVALIERYKKGLPTRE